MHNRRTTRPHKTTRPRKNRGPVVEAPGIEGLKGCRRKPSRDVYLTNNRPTSLAFFVPSGSTPFPRNSSLAARSRPYGVHERVPLVPRSAAPCNLLGGKRLHLLPFDGGAEAAQPLSLNAGSPGTSPTTCALSCDRRREHLRCRGADEDGYRARFSSAPLQRM